jgi:hypothetical protein
MTDIAIPLLFVFLFLFFLLSCQNHTQLLYDTVSDLGAAGRYPEHDLVSFKHYTFNSHFKIRYCFGEHWQHPLCGIQADVE